MNNYKSPFSITNKMLGYISSIMEKIGKLDNFSNLNSMPILRRNNRINSIHSSLSIEANSLTLDEVRNVIDGKCVIGSKKEIEEVKNAYNAYKLIHDINPYNINEIKRIHGIMTYLTVDESGCFRKGNEGVFDNGKCIFIAPKPEMVNGLMNDLFKFINDSKDDIHPLILSSIFHYELVFVHPFSDGNGRMARLWQNIILYKWKPIFEYIPIESQLKKYQNEYYEAIDICNKNGNSNIFIEFMLKMINEIVDELVESENANILHLNNYIAKLLDVMDYNIPMSSNEIMKKLGIKSKENLRKNYLNPAIENGLVKKLIPDKKTSKNQMYYKI